MNPNTTLSLSPKLPSFFFSYWLLKTQCSLFKLPHFAPLKQKKKKSEKRLIRNKWWREGGRNCMCLVTKTKQSLKSFIFGMMCSSHRQHQNPKLFIFFVISLLFWTPHRSKSNGRAATNHMHLTTFPHSIPKLAEKDIILRRQFCSSPQFQFQFQFQFFFCVLFCESV